MPQLRGGASEKDGHEVGSRSEPGDPDPALVVAIYVVGEALGRMVTRLLLPFVLWMKKSVANV